MRGERPVEVEQLLRPLQSFVGRADEVVVGLAGGDLLGRGVEREWTPFGVAGSFGSAQNSA